VFLQYVDEAPANAEPDSAPVLDDGEMEIPSEDEFDERAEASKRTCWHDEDNEDEEPEPVYPNLHPQDPSNFFKLSAALKLLLARKITDSDIDTADALLREYCTELMEVCFKLIFPVYLENC
jgi:hypothetical protein